MTLVQESLVDLTKVVEPANEVAQAKVMLAGLACGFRFAQEEEPAREWKEAVDYTRPTTGMARLDTVVASAKVLASV